MARGSASWASAQPTATTSEAVQQRLRSLKPNPAVLLGKAEVVGEFNDTARKLRPAQDRAAGPRLHDQDGVGPGAEAGPVLRRQPRRAAPAERRLGVRPGVAHLVDALRPGQPPRLHRHRQRLSDVEFKDGILITKRGGPAVIAHTWWGLTYDPAAEGAAVHEHLGHEQEEGGRAARRRPERAVRRPAAVGVLSRSAAAGRCSRPRRRTRGRSSAGCSEYIPELRRHDLARQQLADARHLALRRRQRQRLEDARSPTPSRTISRAVAAAGAGRLLRPASGRLIVAQRH